MPPPIPPPDYPPDEASDDQSGGFSGSGRLPLLLVAVLLLVVAGGITDLALDRPRTWASAHVLLEVFLVALSLTFAVVLWRGWWRAARALDRTRVALRSARRSLAEQRAEREVWRRSAAEALTGLGAAIDRQFTVWRLTPAEREVALLLLKGQGHKQIAGLTGRSERTVRQHAVSVYEKAGLGGRAELAAFFLQGLILPSAGGGSPGAERPASVTPRGRDA